MLPKRGKFGEDMKVNIGVACGNRNMDKGFITFDECMECSGKNGIRCIPRQFLLSYIIKENSDYYRPKWGVYHVNDINMCSSAFLFSRIIGKFFTTRSLWNMRFGTEIHSFYNENEISSPSVEDKVELVSVVGGRKISVVGSQDGYFSKLDLRKFPDVAERIKNDNILSHLFSRFIDNNKLSGVLLERKSTASINKVISGPTDYHINQVKKYIAMREKNDVSSIMITYFDKYEGREINHIIPVIYAGDEGFDEFGDDVLSRSVVINKDKIREMCINKAGMFEDCLYNGIMPLRVPAFSKECSWCVFRDICKHTPNSPILDIDVFEKRIELWSKMLRISDRFNSESQDVSDILARWS